MSKVIVFSPQNQGFWDSISAVRRSPWNARANPQAGYVGHTHGLDGHHGQLDYKLPQDQQSILTFSGEDAESLGGKTGQLSDLIFSEILPKWRCFRREDMGKWWLSIWNVAVSYLQTNPYHSISMWTEF